MSKPFKVHELLSSAELAELEGFAREPGRTIDECHEWLQARGFTLSRGAVGNWISDFRKQCLVERMNGAGGLAKAFMDAAKDSGGLAVPDAAVLQVAQLVFDTSARLASDGDVDPNDLTKMSLALQRLMLAKARLETVRSEFEDRQRQALTEGEKIAKAGGDATSVVDRVREILGVTR